MYLWCTSSLPRENLKFSRSSFRTSPTSVCPFTPVGTMRNTLHTSLQSSKSLIRRGCPRSAGCLQRLFLGGLRRWRISKKPRVLEKLSQGALMLRPARWRLSRLNRCSKKPRRLTTRQLPRRTSNWGTCCPVMHSPNGIASAVICKSVTCGLQ